MFDRALKFVLEREGGYVNDFADPGGATNYGITQATYDRWRVDKDPFPVKDITPAEVEVIYRDRYWLPSGCGLLNWPLALVHFDGAVNHGTDKRNRWRCVKFLQRALGVTDDGVVGPVTREKLDDMTRNYDVYAISEDVIWQRLVFYRRIVQQRSLSMKFLPGWLRRMEHLRAEVVRGW